MLSVEIFEVFSEFEGRSEDNSKASFFLSCLGPSQLYTSLSFTPLLSLDAIGVDVVIEYSFGSPSTPARSLLSSVSLELCTRSISSDRLLFDFGDRDCNGSGLFEECLIFVSSLPEEDER